ncbi:ice nucleation protein-like [Haliaeetus albicilla]|uniref:ice nucleation protein-like n=1 Tax=Haliaeetus albicilla TaxID=8969 RepID=UPI0037E9153D
MERGLRLLALGALLVATAGPCGGAPTPGVSPRCPRSTPPPPPSPPPLPPDCLPQEGDEAPGDATTAAGRVTAARGGGDVVVGTHGDVAMEGTDQPGVTEDPGDALVHVTEAHGDAITTVGRVTVSQERDNVMVATQGDVAMEGTDQPGVTEEPGDTLGHVTEVYRDATTVAGPVVASQSGDNVMVGTHGDVTMEGTEEPGVTKDPRDSLVHVTEAHGDATTMVGHVTMSQGGDNVMVATHRDITMEGTGQPGVTKDPEDTLGHVTEVYRDATTVVGGNATSQGGDNLVVAARGDVVTKGPCVTDDPVAAVSHVTVGYAGDATVAGWATTAQGGDRDVVAREGGGPVGGTTQPDVTDQPGDDSGHVTAGYAGDVTTVGRVTATPGSDEAAVANGGDVLVEGTEGPGVTNCSGDVTEVYRGDTTTVGPITASQGCDTSAVAHGGDVLVEGTEGPGVTEEPGDTLGHVTEVYRDATTMARPVTVSQDGDNVMVGTHDDVAMEGTNQPGVTEDPGATLAHVTDVYRDATTMVGRVTVSQEGHNIMVGTHADVAMEGTNQPGVTEDPGATLGDVTMVYRGDTTTVEPVTATQGGDEAAVAHGGDVLVEGTEGPRVTNCSGDVTEVYRGDTTTVGPITASQGCDTSAVAHGGDILVEGTEGPGVTEEPGVTLGHVTEVYRDATTMVGPVTVSQGGDNIMVGTQGDVTMERTDQPGVTEDPRDTLGDVTMVYRGDTTTVEPVTATQGGDEAAVAHGGDVLVEGTEGPRVTNCSGDVTEVYRGDTTTVGPITASQGCDTSAVAHGGDVLVEGTEGPGVTEEPGVTLGHVTEVYRDATTMVGRVTVSQEGDNVMVATHGDVLMGGTDQPGVTEDPRATLAHVTDVYRDATTMARPVTVSQEGDNVMVGTHDDVAMEGMNQLGVTEDPRDTLGHVTEVYRDATTMVGPVTVSQGGDNIMVGTQGDVTMERTDQPGVTEDPGATLGDVTMVYRGDTTTVEPVTATQGGDNVMVATHGDVLMGGTDQPGVTEDPRATLAHVTDVYRDATTMARPVTVSQEGDNVMVGTHDDVAMEGMNQLGVTEDPRDTLGHVTEVYRDATTMVGRVTVSQEGDNVMVGTHGDVAMEGTNQPGVTEDPGATLGDVTMVYRGDTTTVGPITASQGCDNVMVGTHGDVAMEGTNQPGVTEDPRDTLGDVTMVYRGDTTTVGPITASQGCDTSAVAHGGDVLVEGTDQPGVTEDPRATFGHVADVYRDATTMVGRVTMSQEGDNIMVGTHGDVAMEGTNQPGVTEDPGATLGDVTEVYRGDTTTVGPITASQGGDDVMVATQSDITMEGTNQLGVTEDPGDTLGHVTEVYRDATTVAGRVTVSQGGDDIMVATRDDVAMEGTAQPGVTDAPGDALFPVTEAPGDATTPAGPVPASQGRDDITAPTPRPGHDPAAPPRPHPPNRCPPPPPPAAAFPVTAAPGGPQGFSGASPSPLAPLPLLLLLLPLPLLFP